MITIRFLYQMHEEYGMPGWLQKAMPGYDPLGGMTVAHDCLEHFPGGDATAEDEFQALGAALYVRGEGGYWLHKQQGPGVNVAADLGNILIRVQNGETLHEDGAPRPLSKYLEDELDIADQDVMSEAKYNIDDAESLRELRKMLKTSRAWFRTGYRRAVRRYKVIGPQAACNMFRNIEKAADDAMKAAEVGDELEVSFDIAKAETRVRYIPAYEMYGDDDPPEDNPTYRQRSVRR